MDDPNRKLKLLEQQHEWYKFIPALFEIVAEAKNRTIDFLSSKEEEKRFGVRYFFASKIDYLKSHLKSIGILHGDKLINIYRSNAKLKDKSIPMFSYYLKDRRDDESYKLFDKKYFSLIEGFDMIFDIDSPKKEVMDAYETAKEIKDILDRFKVPYYVKNSGRRGFHFIIPADYLPQMPIEELIGLIRQVLYNIAGILDKYDYIDLSVCNPKGLIKCAYSFDSGNISMPLTDKQFDEFKPELVTLINVKKNIKIMKRGLLIRTHDLTTEELINNTKLFLEHYK